MQSSLIPKPAFYLTALFAFLGFVDSAYLTADKFFALPLPCSLTDGCETVLSSSYSSIGPVPLAAFGALYYLTAFFLAVHLYASVDPKTSTARNISILSGLGVLVSAYLVYLQVEVIQALCAYCLASALVSVLLFIASSLLWRQMSIRVKEQKPNVNF